MVREATEDGSRGWNSVPTSPGASGLLVDHQKLGERPGIDFSSKPPEEANPADSLFKFLVSRVVRELILLL
jgi:hypothetical protein